MSTNRRATWRLLLLIFLLLAVLGVAVWWSMRSPTYVPPTQSTPETTSVTPSPQPTLDPYRPGPAAPSGPRHLTMFDPDFTIEADVCHMAYALPLSPPGDQTHTACWVKEKLGTAPGVPSTGTAYIPGHAWARQPLVFNPFSEKATAAVDFSRPETVNGTNNQQLTRYQTSALTGDSIVLLTDTGRLTYSVSRTWLVGKNVAGFDPDVMDETRPDRIILIACAVKGNSDLEYNVIVEALLVRSEVPTA